MATMTATFTDDNNQTLGSVSFTSYGVLVTEVSDTVSRTYSLTNYAGGWTGLRVQIVRTGHTDVIADTGHIPINLYDAYTGSGTPSSVSFGPYDTTVVSDIDEGAGEVYSYIVTATFDGEEYSKTVSGDTNDKLNGFTATMGTQNFKVSESSYGNVVVNYGQSYRGWTSIENVLSNHYTWKSVTAQLLADINNEYVALSAPCVHTFTAPYSETVNVKWNLMILSSVLQTLPVLTNATVWLRVNATTSDDVNYELIISSRSRCYTYDPNGSVVMDIARCYADGTIHDDGGYLKLNLMQFNREYASDIALSDCTQKTIDIYECDADYNPNYSNASEHKSLVSTITIPDSAYTSAIGLGYTETTPDLLSNIRIYDNKTYQYVLTLNYTESDNRAKSGYIYHSIVNMNISGAENGGIAFGGISTSQKNDPKFESYYPAYFYDGIVESRNPMMTLATLGVQAGKIASQSTAASSNATTDVYFNHPYATGTVPVVITALATSGSTYKYGLMNTTAYNITNIKFTRRLYNADTSSHNPTTAWMSFGERDMRNQVVDSSTNLKGFPDRVLRSNSADGYRVTSASGDLKAYKAFNFNNYDCWEGDCTNGDDWISIELPVQITAPKFYFYSCDGAKFPAYMSCYLYNESNSAAPWTAVGNMAYATDGGDHTYVGTVTSSVSNVASKKFKFVVPKTVPSSAGVSSQRHTVFEVGIIFIEGTLVS